MEDTQMNWKGKIIGEIDLSDYEIKKDLCDECSYTNTFVCKRSVIPFNILEEWVRDKRLVIILFKNRKELYKDLWRWSDHFHRIGFWLNIQCTNTHCDLCGKKSCNERMCVYKTQYPRPKIDKKTKKIKSKGGNKKITFCIKYFGIDPDDIDYDDISFKNNIAYILMRKETPIETYKNVKRKEKI